MCAKAKAWLRTSTFCILWAPYLDMTCVVRPRLASHLQTPLAKLRASGAGSIGAPSHSDSALLAARLSFPAPVNTVKLQAPVHSSPRARALPRGPWSQLSACGPRTPSSVSPRPHAPCSPNVVRDPLQLPPVRSPRQLGPYQLPGKHRR